METENSIKCNRMKAIDLYISPPSPPCRAVIIAAKYMGINFKIIEVDLMKGEQKEDWFVKMNPQHILPTINDNGFVLWESRAIMSYFANKYAPDNPIYPSDAKKRGIVDRFLQYDLNVLARALRDFLIAHREAKSTSKKFVIDIKERKVTESLSYLESVLANNQYVAGDNLTLADFSVYCSLEFADNFQYDLTKYQNIHRYYCRLKQTLNGHHNLQNENLSSNYSTNNDNVDPLTLIHQQNSPSSTIFLMNEKTDSNENHKQLETEDFYQILNRFDTENSVNRNVNQNEMNNGVKNNHHNNENIINDKNNFCCSDHHTISTTNQDEFCFR